MARQRGQVVLRRIEDRRRRGICFRKRRAGMVKKAEELAVLCDADVALLVVSPFDGTFHRFSAPATSIDESSISQLTIEQLSLIERKVERALRKTKARKLEAQRIFTVQEKGKGVLEEKDLVKMISQEEQDLGRYATGSEHSDRDVDLTLRLHTDIGLRRHEMPINLNLP